MVTMMIMMLLAMAKRRLRNFRGWKLTNTATATPLSSPLPSVLFLISFLLASSVHHCSDELLPHGRQRPTRSPDELSGVADPLPSTAPLAQVGRRWAFCD